MTRGGGEDGNAGMKNPKFADGRHAVGYIGGVHQQVREKADTDVWRHAFCSVHSVGQA